VVRDSFGSFLRFVSVLMARERSGAYVGQACHAAARMLHFLKASAPQPYGAAKLRQFKQQTEQLARLKYQLQKIVRHVPFNYKALMEGAKWKGAPELIAFIEEEKRKAVELMKVGASQPSALPCTLLWLLRWRYVGGTRAVRCASPPPTQLPAPPPSPPCRPFQLPLGTPLPPALSPPPPSSSQSCACSSRMPATPPCAPPPKPGARASCSAAGWAT
jgi:hypothetical protein